MSTNKQEERQKKKRQKELRKGLLAFLKRLRQVCKSYESLDDWDELVKPLKSLLDEYVQELPADKAQRLREAMNLESAGEQGIQVGCNFLQKEIEGVIKFLPAGGILAPVVIGAFILVAAGIAVTVALLSSSGREVLIRNQGCGDIIIPTQGINIPGLSLPSEILNNQTVTATVTDIVKMDVEVNASDQMMTVWVLNSKLQIPLQKPIQSLTFDGSQLINQRTTLDLRNDNRHELIFTCP